MALKPIATLRAVELRSLMQVAPSTLSEICRKLEITYANPNGARQGSARYINGSDVRKILESRGYLFSKPIVISFMMCKGGVGKTTSTFFLSQRLSSYGARVLSVDADSQGNLTSAFNLDRYGVECDEYTPILVDVVSGKCDVQDTIIPVTPSIHLIPSTPVNAILEGRIRETVKNPSRPMREILAPILKSYDYVLIDCAPALNLTNAAIVSASNLIILPVAPDKFSQLGLEQTLYEIKQIEADFGFRTEKRIIFTKFDGREFTSLKYLGEIAAKYEKNLRTHTAIRTCADVKNVITRNEDLFALKRSNAKEDYDAFTKEIMELDMFFKKPTRQTSS